MLPDDKITERVHLLHDASDGAYIFSPEIEEDGFQRVYTYSSLEEDVKFQQGKAISQYTLVFSNETTRQ